MTTVSRYTDAELAPLVAEAWRDGHAITDITRAFGTSYRRVNRLLREGGVILTIEDLRSHRSGVVRRARAAPNTQALIRRPRPDLRRAVWWSELLLDPQDQHFLESHRIAVGTDKRGYRRVAAVCRTTGRWFTLARLILGANEGHVVDHINGNSLDNRRCNLRLCLPSENAKNRRKQDGASRFKGVTLYHGKWFAQISSQNRKYYLGLFEREGDAARAYDAAALELHGEFARLNFPDARAA